MTEAEWLTAESPEQLLLWLGAKSRRRRSVRKNGLFVAACASRVKSFMTQGIALQGLELAESMAEGVAGEPECDAFLADFQDVSHPGVPGPQEAARVVPFYAVHVTLPHRIRQSSEKQAVSAARCCAGVYYAANDAPRAIREIAAQADLLRDIIGNPFRPVLLDPAWRMPMALQLAQAIYDERAFERLPILADALESAGCTDAAILGHLRGPGPHVRGCWAVDLCLGLS